MSYTKYICEKDITEIKKSLSKYLSSLETVIPYQYNFNTVKELLDKYYPYEIYLINEKYDYYQVKEKSLVSKGNKSRYKFPKLDDLILNSWICKKYLSEEYEIEHKKNYIESKYQKNVEKFTAKRDPKIKSIFDKIEKNKLKTQQVEPEFLDSLMGLYDRKKTKQKDKVYIMKELEKYYCPKVIKFFSKKVDTEYNKQLRQMAFYHLQSFGFQPTLRKQKYMRIPSKNKKRRKFLKNVYSNEHFNINEIPQELEYRIENAKEQKIKTFDFFISHSSEDYNEVQQLIQLLNSTGKNIYCDWINDNDYLKRHLVGEATLNILLTRLQQAKELIFVISENSMKSSWCKYELNEFYQQGKSILFIRIEDISNKKIKLEKYADTWFVDSKYKEMNLF